METKEALDAAISARVPSVVASVDARLRRQAAAYEITKAAIVELEAAIASASSDQIVLDIPAVEVAGEIVPPVDPPKPQAASRRR